MNPTNARHPSGPDCTRLAPLLSQLRPGTLDPAEEAAVRAHLATCAYCQAELAAHDRLDEQLRAYVQHFAPTAPSADEVARIAMTQYAAASPEMDAENHSHRRRERQRDRDMTMYGTNDTYDSETYDTTQVETYPPHSGRQPSRTPRRHLVLATIAAVLVIGLAATLFAMIARPTQGPTQNKAATATATIHQQAPVPLQLPEGTILLGLSMASPTDGWALGVTADRTSVVLARYHDGQWAIWHGSLPTTQLLVNAHGIAMTSPTDGWITGVGGLLHYTGNQWVAVSIPGTGAVEIVRMVSPTDGWARAFIQTPDKQGGGEGLLHYRNGAWKAVTLPAAVDTGSSAIEFDFSVTPAGECWLMYRDARTGDTTILRYVGGAFQVAYTLPHVQGETITMHSARDGWLTARDASGKTVYHFDGSAWTKQAIPAGFEQQPYLYRVVTSPSGAAWLFGGSGQDNGAVARYRNGAWETVEAPPSIMPPTFSLVADDEGWAIGLVGKSAALYHYQNGSWTPYPN